MKIGSDINKKNLQEITIKSLVWNSVISIFKEEKGVDLTSFLVSINIKGSAIFIKTTKSIINSELILLNDKIKKESQKKISKIFKDFGDFEIKYIV